MTKKVKKMTNKSLKITKINNDVGYPNELYVGCVRIT